MRLKNKLGLILLPFGLATSACSYAAQDQDFASAAQPDARPALADGVQGNLSQYDEVGYASTQNGDDAAFVAASHRSLPVPSYVEVTNLDTGRTILVRIADNAVAGGRLIALSPAAARQLGVEAQDRVPVRVRRTNPPEFERAVLRNGQTAGERMPTPAALLSALRKKLGAPANVAIASDLPVSVPAPVSRPVRPKTPLARPGATFAQPPVGASAPAASVRTASDRFVVEDARSRPVRGAPIQRAASPQATAPEPVATSGGFFVQIASFGVQARAVALARKEGGSVQAAGSVWRVRMGPYENEASARAALGQAQAKGYRDARVAR
jgi:rare lipoprotein A